MVGLQSWTTKNGQTRLFRHYWVKITYVAFWHYLLSSRTFTKSLKMCLIWSVWKDGIDLKLVFLSCLVGESYRSIFSRHTLLAIHLSTLFRQRCKVHTSPSGFSVRKKDIDPSTILFSCLRKLSMKESFFSTFLPLMLCINKSLISFICK